VGPKYWAAPTPSALVASQCLGVCNRLSIPTRSGSDAESTGLQSHSPHFSTQPRTPALFQHLADLLRKIISTARRHHCPRVSLPMLKMLFIFQPASRHHSTSTATSISRRFVVTGNKSNATAYGFWSSSSSPQPVSTYQFPSQLVTVVKLLSMM